MTIVCLKMLLLSARFLLYYDIRLDYSRQLRLLQHHYGDKEVIMNQSGKGFSELIQSIASTEQLLLIVWPVRPYKILEPHTIDHGKLNV